MTTKVKTSDLKRLNMYLTDDNYRKFEILKVLAKAKNPGQKNSVTVLVNEMVSEFYESHKPDKAIEELMLKK